MAGAQCTHNIHTQANKQAHKPVFIQHPLTVDYAGMQTAATVYVCVCACVCRLSRTQVPSPCHLGGSETPPSTRRQRTVRHMGGGGACRRLRPSDSVPLSSSRRRHAGAVCTYTRTSSVPLPCGSPMLGSVTVKPHAPSFTHVCLCSCVCSFVCVCVCACVQYARASTPTHFYRLRWPLALCASTHKWSTDSLLSFPFHTYQ